MKHDFILISAHGKLEIKNFFHSLIKSFSKSFPGVRGVPTQTIIIDEQSWSDIVKWSGEKDK